MARRPVPLQTMQTSERRLPPRLVGHASHTPHPTPPARRLPAPSEGIVSIGNNHERLRPLVLERDGHVCQVAGPGCLTVATVAGHIRARVHHGTNTLDNYRAECLHCSSVDGARLAAKIPRRAKKVASFFREISLDPTAVPALSPTSETKRV